MFYGVRWTSSNIDTAQTGSVPSGWLTWAECYWIYFVRFMCPDKSQCWPPGVSGARRDNRRIEREEEGEKTNIPDPRPWLETQHTCNVSSAINEAMWLQYSTCTLSVLCDRLCLGSLLDVSLEPLVVIFILCNNQHTLELPLHQTGRELWDGWVFPFAQQSNNQTDSEIIRLIGVLT